MERLVPLGSADAADTAVAGEKASWLARAADVGLPVLPGWVVPLEASAAAIELGTWALEAHGRASAVLAVSGMELEPGLARELGRVAGATGTAHGTWAVRSSTTLDGDGRWAGAFGTYLDVDPDAVTTAVRGCWASAFASDVLARAAALELPPRDLRVAVLIQLFLRLDAGGTARCEADGTVTVSATTGSPAALMSGRGAGVVVRVGAGGSILGDPPDAPDPRIVAEAAEVARATVAATGTDTIEWGWATEAAWLLQARPSHSQRPPTRRPAERRFPVGSRVASLARTATRFPAPLGDELVIPWALGTEEVPTPEPLRVDDPVGAFAEARALAASLAAEVWERPADAAVKEAGAVSRLLLGPEPGSGLTRLLERLPRTRSAAAAGRAHRLLGLVAGIGDHMASLGTLDHPEQVWRLTTEEIQRALGHGTPPPSRRGPDRWEPFVFQSVMSAGRAAEGIGAAPGIGAGRVFVIDGPQPPPPRSILGCRAPVPQLASRLWGASGVVTAGGSPAAHLFEVARSLGIPAVVGVNLLDAVDGDLAAVDGVGRVSILEAALPSAGRPWLSPLAAWGGA